MIILQIEVDLDGQKLLYKREFREALFNDIEVRVNHITGKVVVDKENEFYFAAFKDKKLLLPVQITNGRLLKKIENQVELVQDKIKSQSSGRGKFKIKISKSDLENQVKYIL